MRCSCNALKIRGRNIAYPIPCDRSGRLASSRLQLASCPARPACSLASWQRANGSRATRPARLLHSWSLHNRSVQWPGTPGYWTADPCIINQTNDPARPAIAQRIPAQSFSSMTRPAMLLHSWSVHNQSVQWPSPQGYCKADPFTINQSILFSCLPGNTERVYVRVDYHRHTEGVHQKTETLKCILYNSLFLFAKDIKNKFSHCCLSSRLAKRFSPAIYSRKEKATGNLTKNPQKLMVT